MKEPYTAAITSVSSSIPPQPSTEREGGAFRSVGADK